jgi:aryl-phospho-beta-D-glucosidase BglC (GH1 family)
MASGSFTVSADTVVSTELIDYSGMTSAEAQQMVNTFYEQGIRKFIVRLNAFNDYASGQPSSATVKKAKEIIDAATAKGMSVSVDLHTWYTTVTTIFGSATDQASYINYVRNAIHAFDDYPVEAFMVMNEPPAKTATSSESDYILSVIAAAKAETSKPVSVRFMGGWSPDTGRYSTAIDDACDFLCRNSYWDPRKPGTSVYQVSQSVMNNMIANARSRGKELWITEFGKTNSDQAEQAAYIQAWVAWAKDQDIDRIHAWVSKPLGTGETYNIFTGTRPFTALPAFYELLND